ncbi:hypothetical protein BJ165DRAFT_1477091 [Panaeolus papilionaceus]|nr:hypothetical protein BJ165DRAFT_1477091 [Panaeolus papilionaceus]
MFQTFQVNINGYYTYGSWEMLFDDGQTELQINVDPETGVIYGGGHDNPGRFTVTGILVDNEMRFIKSYRGNTSASWKYVGKRLPSAENDGIMRFAGGWGSPYGSRNDGQFVFAAVIDQTRKPCSNQLNAEHKTHHCPCHGDNVQTTGVTDDTEGFKALTQKTRIKSAVKRAALLPASCNQISQNLIFTLESSFRST